MPISLAGAKRKTATTTVSYQPDPDEDAQTMTVEFKQKAMTFETQIHLMSGDLAQQVTGMRDWLKQVMVSWEMTAPDEDGVERPVPYAPDMLDQIEADLAMAIGTSIMETYAPNAKSAASSNGSSGAVTRLKKGRRGSF